MWNKLFHADETADDFVVPNYDHVNPGEALQDTLAREKRIRIEFKQKEVASQNEVGKLRLQLNSVQNLNAKMAEDLRTLQTQTTHLDRKAKENAATIKTLEQQASQSFKLAQEVRERQREIAKLQEQLRGGGGSVISSSLLVASPDLERETIALRTKTKESDEKIRLQLAEIRKLQTELAHSKNVASVTPASLKSGAASPSSDPDLILGSNISNIATTTPAIAGFSFTSTAMSSTRTGNYTALVDVLAAPLSKRGGSVERIIAPTVSAFNFGSEPVNNIATATSSNSAISDGVVTSPDARLSYEYVAKLERELRRLKATVSVPLVSIPVDDSLTTSSLQLTATLAEVEQTTQRLQQCQRELEAQKCIVGNREAELSALQTAMAMVTTRLERSQQSGSTLTADLQRQLSVSATELLRVQHQYQRAQDELVDLRASVNPADTNQSDERIESERTLRVAAESQLLRVTNDASDLRAQIRTSQTAVEDAVEQQKLNATRLLTLQAEISQRSADLKTRVDEIKTLETRLSSARQQLAEEQQRQGELKGQVSSMSLQMAHIRGECDTAQAEAKTQHDTVEHLMQQLRSAEEQHNLQARAIESAKKEFSSQIQTRFAELSAIQVEYQRATDSLTALQQNLLSEQSQHRLTRQTATETQNGLVQNLSDSRVQLKDAVDRLKVESKSLAETTTQLTFLREEHARALGKWQTAQTETAAVVAALQQTLQQRSADLAAVKQALVEESADKKIVAEELERKKKALAVFHFTLVAKMEAKRVAQAEAEQRVLDEAERVATAERLADEEEQAKRKASFFYSMFNKNSGRSSSSIPVAKSGSAAPLLRASTSNTLLQASGKPLNPTAVANVVRPVSSASAVPSTGPDDLVANHPELVDEMEEQVSLALAARLARAEEENYYLSERLAGRDSQVEMLTNYVGELRSKPASSIPGIGGGATKAGLSAAVLRVTAAQAAAPKLIPPKVATIPAKK